MVAVVSSEGRVDGVGAHVTDRRRQRPSNFTLDAQVPVQCVIWLRILIEGISLKFIGTEGNAGKGWERTYRQIAGANRIGEWEGTRFLDVVFPGTWKDVEDPETTTDGRFPIAERVPREADPWLGILQSRIGPVQARYFRWKADLMEFLYQGE